MKRKIGLIIGYDGSGFHGLQSNAGVDTVEHSIIKALLDLELISELNSQDRSKIDMKSASRTDKNVHALFNLVSCKICKEPSVDIENSLRNRLIKDKIHLYKMIRLPKRFIGYKAARSRTYKYVVPTYFLKEGNYLKENEKRKREVKIEHAESKNYLECDQNEENIKFKDDKEISKDPIEYKQKEYNKELINEEKCYSEVIDYKHDNIEKFKEVMQKYVGTHDFKSFTVKKTTNNTKRFIRSIKVSEPFEVDKIEYVEIILHGQSFLLHQIRKMIFFAVLNVKYAGLRIDENFDIAFNNYIHIPRAPSQYLYIHNIFFDDFNRRAVERIEIDESERIEFENRIVKPLIYKKENIIEWFKLFDSIILHDENFEFLKK